MRGQKFFSIPVFAVFFLLGFFYHITVFIFIEDWVGLGSSAGSLSAMIFTFLASLCLLSLFVSVSTDPGRVPSSYLPDVEDNSSFSDQESKKNGVQSKYCDKCDAHKPPRAHHCRVCKRCILRMDHHCPWINNCVGYWNYKAFFSLMFYTTMASVYSTVIIICCAYQKDWNYSGTVPLRIFYFACGAMMLALSVTLGSQLGWHIYLITRNMTTIEYYEGIQAAWFAKKSGLRYRHPFDISVYKNITLVLGPNILSWLWPTSVSHLKDGVSFPTLRDSS